MKKEEVGAFPIDSLKKYHLGFIVGLSEGGFPTWYPSREGGGSSNMVSESGGLEFEPQPRTFRCE
jgi:hypothetical protein